MGGPWLFAISEASGRNFDLKDRPIPVAFDSYRELVENGRLAEDKFWRIGQLWKKVERGDKLFIYMGDRNLGIIGYATIKDLLKKPDGNWYVVLEFGEFDLKKCKKLLEKPIPAHIVRSWKLSLRRNLTDLSSRASELHSLLPWSKPFSIPEEIPDYHEGSAEQISVNRYERSVDARRRCIEEHKAVCCICGFDFGKRFGAEFDGYIHVHHLRLLSEIGHDYEVDPVIDLRPVCPNCHAVIHHGGQLRGIEEVKRLLTANNQA